MSTSLILGLREAKFTGFLASAQCALQNITVICSWRVYIWTWIYGRPSQTLIIVRGHDRRRSVSASMLQLTGMPVFQVSWTSVVKIATLKVIHNFPCRRRLKFNFLSSKRSSTSDRMLRDSESTSLLRQDPYQNAHCPIVPKGDLV